jgi:hypothetical protein
MTENTALRSRLNRWQWLALLVGLGGGLLCVLGYGQNPTQFFRSYLMAYLFWLWVSVGCLAILMLHHLVGGAWGVLIRRLLEAGTRLLPLMAVLAVPLVFGVHDLYVWARPGEVEGHETAQFRQVYLQLPFFWWRAGFYFVAWLALAYFLNRWSHQQEQTQDAAVVRSRRRRLALLSGGGMVLYGLTVTFAAVDWMMSLEPHWFSTIYGFLVISGQLVAAMAFAIGMTGWLANVEPLASVMSPGYVNDLGNLLLAFVMLWAYCAFSQFLIMWSGNLPEEIQWYLHRSHGGWNWLRLLLLLFHFAVPFFLLLSRGIKGQVWFLSWVAATLFVMHVLDIYWLVMPAFFPEQLHVHWLDIVAPLSLGGLWLAVWMWQLKRRSLVPFHEPRLQEMMQHG